MRLCHTVVFVTQVLTTKTPAASSASWQDEMANMQEESGLACMVRLYVFRCVPTAYTFTTVSACLQCVQIYARIICVFARGTDVVNFCLVPVVAGVSGRL